MKNSSFAHLACAFVIFGHFFCMHFRSYYDMKWPVLQVRVFIKNWSIRRILWRNRRIIMEGKSFLIRKQANLAREYCRVAGEFSDLLSLMNTLHLCGLWIIAPRKHFVNLGLDSCSFQSFSRSSKSLIIICLLTSEALVSI